MACRYRKPEWCIRLRERVGPGVCLYCEQPLIQPSTGGRREVCPGAECQRSYRRDYDTGGRANETPEWVIDAVADLKLGRERLEAQLSDLKARVAALLREA